MQVECVLRAIEEAIQTLENTQIVVSLRQLHVHAKEYHRVLLPTTCTMYWKPRQAYKLIVDIEQVELLRSSEFTWVEVAQILGISRTTLW